MNALDFHHTARVLAACKLVEYGGGHAWRHETAASTGGNYFLLLCDHHNSAPRDMGMRTRCKLLTKDGKLLRIRCFEWLHAALLTIPLVEDTAHDLATYAAGVRAGARLVLAGWEYTREAQTVADAAPIISAQVAEHLQAMREAQDAAPTASEILGQIHAALDGVEWSADTSAEIADILTANGYEIRDCNEVES